MLQQIMTSDAKTKFDVMADLSTIGKIMTEYPRIEIEIEFVEYNVTIAFNKAYWDSFGGDVDEIFKYAF